ncbi:MAG TPA: hypothetical protein VFC00_31665 [Micromonosporaceae bacterium]|nr:hypothetical protein [Micromonosporaceae bacterium]
MRERNGRTQDDVARAARDCGLSWDRARVAALERGEKAVSAEELVILPTILTLALMTEVVLPDLLAEDVDVLLAGGSRMSGREVAQVLAGQFVDHVLPTNEALAAEFEAALQAFIPVFKKVQARMKKLDLPGRISVAYLKTEGEAEAKAAAKFGEQRVIISGAALDLWGRSLTAERDARLAEEVPPDAPPRTVQAKRGHITRRLLAEMAERLGKVLDDG